MSGRQPYLTALRFRWLTRFYDRAVGLLLNELSLKGRLVRQARIGLGHRVLDIGCGTGTLTLMAHNLAGYAQVVGVDGDLEALAMARRKTPKERPPLRLCVALAEELPFADGTFDRAISSLFFHHLTRASKRSALRSIGRALTETGELHILDWGRAQDPLMRMMFVLVQVLDGFAITRDNVLGRLPAILSDAGFAEAKETHRERSILGTLSLYRGRVGDGSPFSP